MTLSTVQTLHDQATADIKLKYDSYNWVLIAFTRFFTGLGLRLISTCTPWQTLAKCIPYIIVFLYSLLLWRLGLMSAGNLVGSKIYFLTPYINGNKLFFLAKQLIWKQMFEFGCLILRCSYNVLEYFIKTFFSGFNL